MYMYAEAAHFTLKMTVLGELCLYCVVLHCESLGLNILCTCTLYAVYYHDIIQGFSRKQFRGWESGLPKI